LGLFINIIREEIQIRFLNEIEKVSKKTFKKPKLYGWGANSFGQLAVNTGNAVVGNPSEVLLPELAKDDTIKEIECGSKASILLTLQGNVWISEPIEKKVIKEEESKQTHVSKKHRKEPSEPVKDKEQIKGGSKWLSVTSKCERLK